MCPKSIKKNLIVGLTILGIFFVITYSLNNVSLLAIFNVSGIRLSAVMNPILGIIFGWPAILGCAFGNFFSDLFSPGYGISIALLGFVPQIIYGALPFYTWKKYVVSTSQRTRLDSPRKTIAFAILMAINSLVIGVAVGAIQYYVAHQEFWLVTYFAAMNDFDMCMILGLPMMSIADNYYSKVKHAGKRKISFNERIILISSVFQVMMVVCIVIWTLGFGDFTDTKLMWSHTLSICVNVINCVIVLSVIAMFFAAYLRKKHVGLRIFEKKNGTLFVDEKKRLEFVSAPGREFKYRVKSEKLGYSYDNGRSVARLSYEDSWLVTLSNQKGCPMRCVFCDCPGYGFYGNASFEDFEYQLKTILDNTGSTFTKRFEVNFMRMGEPTFNDDILKFIEFRMRDMILEKVQAEEIIPTISTMFPRRKEQVIKYLKEYCRIINDVYNGKAGLQFSINTTDESIRNEQFQGLSMSIKDIADVVEKLPYPKERKYELNFAITKDSKIDAKMIDKLFDKNKCMVKLTPIHENFNAIDNGFIITSEYQDFEVFKSFEQSFIEIGWDVIIYLDSKAEDDDALTCGNLLLSNISEKLSNRNLVKKKVGMVVAIEMEAFFERFPNNKEINIAGDYKLFFVEQEEFDLYVLQCGMGEIATAAGVEYLISQCGVSTIVNFGVVGGLTKTMKKLKVCLVDRVVHYKYDCSEFLDLKVGQVFGHDSIFIKTDENLVKKAQVVMNDVKMATCCSGDKFVSTEEEKIYLHKAFEGDVCDMESAAIVLTCEANHVPCLIIKAVSDGLTDGAAGFFAELKNASMLCLDVLAQVMEKISLVE